MTVRCPGCNAENMKFSITCEKCGFILNSRVIPGSLKPLLPGEKLVEKYEVIARIKSGGMGSIYKAKHLNSGRICAVKELLNLSMDKPEQEEAIKRFKRESKILSELKHPSMPSVHDYFSVNRRYYLVMDFIDGTDLSTMLEGRKGKGLTEKDVVGWAIQICDILAYLHNLRPPVVYRDIKPSNIMIRKSDNKAILIDFGIARTVQTEEEISLTKTAIGTIAYMSPEQYRGKPCPGSDIYSLGATMHHLLSGNQPIPFAYFPLTKERPDISERVNAVIMTAVQINEEDRFRSAEEMKKALTGMIEIKLPAIEDIITEEEETPEADEADSNMRKEFIETLGESKTQSGKESLIIMARNEKKPLIRKSVLENLGKFDGDKEIEITLNYVLLNDTSSTVRASAARIMKGYNDRRFSDSLIEALSDIDEEVRIEAISGLRKLKEKKALEPLYKIVREEKGIVKEEALFTLENLAPELIKEWKEKEKKEKNIIENKKYIHFIIFTGLILITSLFLFKYVNHGYRSQQVNNYLKKGFLHIEYFEMEQARENFEKAGKLSKNLSLLSEEAMALYGTGLSYYLEGENGQTREYLEKALKCDKQIGGPYLYLGRIYLYEKNYQKSITNLEKAKELMPHNPDVYRALIEFYNVTEEEEKAQSLTEEAKEKFQKFKLVK